MQVPIPLMIRNGLHALTRKIVEVLISSLATLLIMAIFPSLTKPTFRFAQDDGGLPYIHGGPAGEETSEAVADLMERVALSHVAALRAPLAATSEPTNVATSEPATAAVVPLPPQAPAPPRHDRASSSKAHASASIPKFLPPAKPPLATIESAVASAPVNAEALPPLVASAPVKAEPLPPLQYGMRLVVNNLGNIISASQTRVVESVTSVGDTLTSLGKKL
jgi:hypothetical protein